MEFPLQFHITPNGKGWYILGEEIEVFKGSWTGCPTITAIKVEEEQRGKGIGTHAIRFFLHQLRMHNKGFFAIGTTASERLLAILGRLEKQGEIVPAGGGPDLPLYRIETRATETQCGQGPD